MRRTLFLILAAAALCAPSVAMAAQAPTMAASTPKMAALVDSRPGISLDFPGVGNVEVHSFSFGASRGSLAIGKLSGKISTACATGKRYPKLTLRDGSKGTYMLTNVVIAGRSAHATIAGAPAETMSLNFTKISKT